MLKFFYNKNKVVVSEGKRGKGKYWKYGVW